MTKKLFSPLGTQRLFHASVKQMKQVKQDFESNIYLSIIYKKQVKQKTDKALSAKTS
jgi:hypothetical protein